MDEDVGAFGPQLLQRLGTRRQEGTSIPSLGLRYVLLVGPLVLFPGDARWIVRLVKSLHRLLQDLLEDRVNAEQGLHPGELRLHDGQFFTGVPGLADLEHGVVQLWTLLG